MNAIPIVNRIAMLLILSFLNACYKEVPKTDISELTDWSAETHEVLESPNYDVVFAQNVVNRIDLEISSENWQTMLNDMEEKYGAFGSGGEIGGPGGPGGGPGGPGAITDESDPVFVPATVIFGNKHWYNVGVRFKGNSSLQSTWQMGIMKLSFKLDFDEFESDYPEIYNQRFYGFKQLNLKNNYDDVSCMREKIATDIFERAGLAVPKTAYYRLYVDYGEGQVYFGMYSMVEEVDDSMIDHCFSSDSGNLYKPEGNAASFANGSFNTTDFYEKNNTGTDWSDVENLYNILNNDIRISDPELWKYQLESVFNVDVFLNWLAVNILIQNWDTYGKMAHNYYLYNNPENGKLTWIPWDNNEALSDGKMGGALSISLSEVNESWPLISYLLSDSEYNQKYKDFMQACIENNFEPGKMTAIYTENHNLIQEYVSGDSGEIEGYTFLNSSSEFDEQYNYLLNHVVNRVTVATNYLQGN